MDKDNYKSIVIKNYLEICLNYKNDEICMLEIVRYLREFSSYFNLSDEDINFLIAVDSDTDDVPVGDFRKLWNSKKLKELDSKLTPYLVKVAPRVHEIVNKVLKNYNK